MSLSLVTNGNFETALTALHSATGLVYGGYTRTDSVVDADPNSNLPITVTSAAGVAFEISYDQVVDTEVARRIILEAHSGSNLNAQLSEFRYFLKGLYVALNDDANQLFSNSFYQDVIKAFRILPQIVAQPAWVAYSDFKTSASTSPAITWTAVDGGSQEIDFAFTSNDGAHLHMLIVSINDGEHVLIGDEDIANASVVMAGGADDYDVEVFAYTNGGFLREVVTVTVA